MFCKLMVKDGTELFVRPNMVKAVYEKGPTTSVVIIDGHDFEVIGTPMDIMHQVQFDCHSVSDPHPEA